MKRCLRIPVYIFSKTPCFFGTSSSVILHTTLLAEQPLLLALPIPWHTTLLPSSIPSNSQFYATESTAPPKKSGKPGIKKLNITHKEWIEVSSAAGAPLSTDTTRNVRFSVPFFSAFVCSSGFKAILATLHLWRTGRLGRAAQNIYKSFWVFTKSP